MTSRPDASSDPIVAWATARVPGDWFVDPLSVAADELEILIVGRLGAPREAASAACAARIDAFRAATRAERVAISAEGERRFGRRVSWGAACGDVQRLFSGLGVPVMTRLRLPERALLDVLVEGGVARSRSDALAWCVRLVAANQGAWIDELRTVVDRVRRVRASGPRA